MRTAFPTRFGCLASCTGGIEVSVALRLIAPAPHFGGLQRIDARSASSIDQLDSTPGTSSPSDPRIAPHSADGRRQPPGPLRGRTGRQADRGSSPFGSALQRASAWMAISSGWNTETEPVRHHRGTSGVSCCVALRAVAPGLENGNSRSTSARITDPNAEIAAFRRAKAWTPMRCTSAAGAGPVRLHQAHDRPPRPTGPNARRSAALAALSCTRTAERVYHAGDTGVFLDMQLIAG